MNPSLLRGPDGCLHGQQDQEVSFPSWLKLILFPAHDCQAGVGEQESGGACANNPFFLRQSKVEDNPSI
jgi:hypothetical protein